jgi:hypothetical protein
MDMVSGIYAGAGTSALYIGLGFIPSKVEIFNLDQAEQEILIWNDAMARAAASPGGQIRSGLGSGSANFAVLAQDAGVEPWDGGDIIATASANYIVLAGEVAAYAGDQRDKGAAAVRQWTLGSSDNRTGNFDNEVDTDFVGMGSVVEIDGKRYKIQVLTNNGEQANEVTLDRAAPSGRVNYIGYKLDFVQAPAGTVMPKGLKVNDVTYVNESGQECEIRAYR